MPFPKTFTEMQQAGYKFDGHARCKGCQEEIEFWITPRAKKIPMNLMPNPDSEAKSHWSTCKDADLFR